MSWGELDPRIDGDDYHYGSLKVCGTCTELFGTFYLAKQELVIHYCRCARVDRFDPKHRWPRFDFNVAAELCYCCGQVLLRSGIKFAVWFCDACKDQVRLLNARLGRYVVPIGRHSVMGGLGLGGVATPVEMFVFCEEWNGVLTSMRSVHKWKRRVVHDVLAERWDDPPHEVPVLDYLARCTPSEEETMRRFRDMMGFLSQPEEGGR